MAAAIFKTTLGASLRDAMMTLCPQSTTTILLSKEGVHPDDDQYG